MPDAPTRGRWPGGANPWSIWARRQVPTATPLVPVPAVEQRDGKAALKIQHVARAKDVPEQGLYVGPEGLTDSFEAATNVKGNPGTPGESVRGDPGRNGVDGANGWTPVTTGEKDGVRSLILVDYVGGSGTKPASGYIGPRGSTGLVSKAQAFNFNPTRSMVFMGSTNAQGDYTVTLPEPMANPYISPTLYPSTAAERMVRLTNIAKNAAGLVTGFTVRVEQRAALTVLGLQVLAAVVTVVPSANVSVIVVDVS